MVSTLTRRLVMGLVLLVAVVIGGGVGYYLIGRGAWSLGDCVYMTVITVTTVGYGEVLHDMDKVAYARGFTMVLLMFGTGSIVYFASTVTAFIIEGDLRNVLFASRLKKRMKRMKDHVVVCGAGSTGRHVIEELLATGASVLAIDLRESSLREIADRFPKAEYAYLVGDATDDDVMAQTGLERARGLVAALSSDKDNLYLTVSGRQVNPGVRIVARCAELSHVRWWCWARRSRSRSSGARPGRSANRGWWRSDTWVSCAMCEDERRGAGAGPDSCIAVGWRGSKSHGPLDQAARRGQAPAVGRGAVVQPAAGARRAARGAARAGP